MRTAVIFGCSKGNGSLREQAVWNPESKQVSNQNIPIKHYENY